MKKITIIITFVVFAWFHSNAQDTLEYGTDRYLFSTRPLRLCGVQCTYNNIDTVYSYANISLPSMREYLLFNVMESSEPITIYGLAAIIGYPQNIIDRSITTILFKAGDSNLIYLDSTSIVTNQNYFIYEYNNITKDSLGQYVIVAIDSTVQQALPIYEFYFDSGITVQDSFFVGVCNNSGRPDRNPILYQIGDTVGDKNWDYNGQARAWYTYSLDFSFFLNINPRYMFGGFPWGGIFPIIQPLQDTADSTGVRQVVAAGSVRVEPNPAHGSVSVRAAEGLRRVEFFDMTGLRVLSRESYGTAISIDIAALPAGVYIVRVHTTKGIVSRKLVVM